MEKTKTCTKCKECKPITDFTIDNTLKDGRTYNCKECIKAYYVKRNTKPEVKLKLKERNFIRKEYYSSYKKQNREKINAADRLRRSINPENTKLIDKKRTIYNTVTLSNKYIRNLLRVNGQSLKGITIPQEIIELKRIQIKTYRLCQQLQN